MTLGWTLHHQPRNFLLPLCYNTPLRRSRNHGRWARRRCRCSGRGGRRGIIRALALRLERACGARVAVVRQVGEHELAYRRRGLLLLQCARSAPSENTSFVLALILFLAFTLRPGKRASRPMQHLPIKLRRLDPCPHSVPLRIDVILDRVFELLVPEVDANALLGVTHADGGVDVEAFADVVEGHACTRAYSQRVARSEHAVETRTEETPVLRVERPILSEIDSAADGVSGYAQSSIYRPQEQGWVEVEAIRTVISWSIRYPLFHAGEDPPIVSVVAP